VSVIFHLRAKNANLLDNAVYPLSITGRNIRCSLVSETPRRHCQTNSVDARQRVGVSNAQTVSEGKSFGCFQKLRSDGIIYVDTRQ